jgi:glycine/D-amino acid oxidase-like deaminating enzyme
LIVGQGLAGTVLSFFFTQLNMPHRFIDNKHHSAATLAAAGLVNPITGRSYVKSWMIEELLPIAIETYKSLSAFLGIELLRTANILRTLRTPAQINKWNESTAREGYDQYLVSNSSEDGYFNALIDPCQFGEIQQSIQVDIAKLIKAYQNYLVRNNRISFEKFDHSCLIINDDCVVYKNTRYDKLIFCEGYQAVINPIFKTLPFKLAKGQSLELTIPALNAPKILRDEIFLVPLASNNFWTGGTYAWDFEDDEPTQEWRKEWLTKVENLIKLPYNVESHKAGIRPTVRDRRPFIGHHKKYKPVYIFNGMGTKGTSLAPYWAKHLVEHLVHHKAIHPDVNINRFDY